MQNFINEKKRGDWLFYKKVLNCNDQARRSNELDLFNKTCDIARRETTYQFLGYENSTFCSFFLGAKNVPYFKERFHFTSNEHDTLRRRAPRYSFRQCHWTLGRLQRSNYVHQFCTKRINTWNKVFFIIKKVNEARNQSRSAKLPNKQISEMNHRDYRNGQWTLKYSRRSISGFHDRHINSV